MRRRILTAAFALILTGPLATVTSAQEPSKELLDRLGAMIIQMHEASAKYGRKLTRKGAAFGRIDAGKARRVDLGELASGDYQVAIACAKCGGLSTELQDEDGAVIESQPKDFPRTFYLIRVTGGTHRRFVNISPRECEDTSCEFGVVFYLDEEL